MNVVGVIAEYNPFHNGHLFHLRTAKTKCDARYAICIMSGHFLQRGEPAMFDKWSRAAMAVSAGADIVFELPYVYACRSAGVFARGGVELLASTGIVTHLCFGSESGSIEQLKEVATLLANESPTFKSLLQEKLQCGMSYPAARFLALQHYCRLANPSIALCNTEVLTHPNNTLGIEYLISLAKLDSKIVPITIKRHVANYHDTTIEGSITSATAIRNVFENNGLNEEIYHAVPASTINIIKKSMKQSFGPIFTSDYCRSILSLLRRIHLDELASILDVTEGLEYKLKEAANAASSMENLLAALKSKRYTRTRLQRILIYCMLNFTKRTAETLDHAGPQYLRVLAFSEKGQVLLKRMRDTASLPIIHRPAAYRSSITHAPISKLEQMLQFDILSTDLYVLGCPQPQRGGLDYLTRAVRVENRESGIGSRD